MERSATMNSSKRVLFILFSIYTYCFNIIHIALEVLPTLIRNAVFKIMFKTYGQGSFIDYRTYFRYPKKILIGNSVFINRGTKIYASHYAKDAFVIIKNNVSIGPEVSIFSAGHDYSSLDLPDTGKSVTIGDHVWIGGRAIIMPGVEIGEGAVIGAGSLVTRSIPPYSIAVGSPAKVIKTRNLLKQK